MSNQKPTDRINARYSALAETSCCLSCGGAIEYAQPRVGDVCVDLGSGRGNDVIRMAEAVGEKGFAYGVDVSDGMLEKALRNAEKLGISNVRFVRSELENLDLPSDIADLVISNCTINHARDKAKTWSEVHRILKTGGRFVVSDIYSLKDVPDIYRNDPQAVAECWAGSVRRDAYLKTLEECGFTGIKILEESQPYSKGQIQVASFTVTGTKPGGDCCSCS
ncbi:MAG: hypothetical protein A2X94_10830 [Bdellovibrionales bacterium GWB1_55_8]|nr:MAG: hypothetical protein A2X94_10830 [Bdellovibrionales bacterium GWB1_55_8]